jgi:hypothetical protein
MKSKSLKGPVVENLMAKLAAVKLASSTIHVRDDATSAAPGGWRC